MAVSLFRISENPRHATGSEIHIDGSRADGHIVAQRHSTSSPQPIKTNVMFPTPNASMTLIIPASDQVIGKVLRKT